MKNLVLNEIKKVLDKDIILEKPKDKEKQNNIPADKFEEVRKYKQLLDEGIITPEEYDAKKQSRFDREEGIEIRDISLIQKKIKRGKSLETIADELESSVEEIKALYDAISQCPPDMDPEDILAKL